VLLVDYHVHAMGHGEREHTMADLEPFVIQAIKKGVREIGFTDHDWVCKDPDFKLFKKLQKKYPKVTIRVGLEVDHIIGREKEIASFLRNQPFDYVVGGVHHLGESRWMFDLPEHVERYNGKNIDDVYREYFETVKHAASSGLYQIMAHLDLMKVFGFRPKKRVLSLMGDLLEIIKERSLVVEINTNGLFKPVGEIYPALDILKRCFELEIPVTLSSDAHRWEDVGRELEAARSLAKKVGFRQIATFEQGKMILKKI